MIVERNQETQKGHSLLFIEGVPKMNLLSQIFLMEVLSSFSNRKYKKLYFILKLTCLDQIFLLDCLNSKKNLFLHIKNKRKKQICLLTYFYTKKLKRHQIVV